MLLPIRYNGVPIMFMIPTAILSLWCLSLWSLGLLAGGVVLLHEWYERSWHVDPVLGAAVFRPVFAADATTALLIGGIICLLVTFTGNMLLRPLLRAVLRSAPEERVDGIAPPKPVGMTQRLRRTDGTEIQVESWGPETGFPVVLTHGGGDNRREWEYVRRGLSDSGYRLIAWDLPGLGNSQEPVGRDYRMESLARDLDLVLRETCGDRPAVLVGHSIGGMTLLTYCRLFPEALGTRVAGLILAHTTYTNPVRTSKGAPLFTALEKPLLVPLLYLTIAVSPLLRLLGMMSYYNGAAHLNSWLSGFAGTQSWEQLDFTARFNLQSPPAVLARSMLGMLRYDATETLKTVTIPALLVTGDRDTSCVPEASEWMAREIPHTRLVVLSPANHMGLVEHYAAFTEAVRGFLAGCFAATAPLIR